jgi:hypothetical protein
VERHAKIYLMLMLATIILYSADAKKKKRTVKVMRPAQPDNK